MNTPLSALEGPVPWQVAAPASRYTEDPRDRFKGKPVPVYLPRTTQEVTAVVRACAETNTCIIPYGGGTGVVGGQLVFEAQNTILLSLEKMKSIRSVSLDDAVMVVDAGCVLADIQAAAQEAGMIFPLSMASEGSSQIGGNLATNCGGIQVLRHGNARDLCLGIEAVLPDGSVLNELSPLRKNNTGYDLRHLLIGSEGTLGIITGASLVLKPAPAQTLTAYCAVARPADAVAFLRALRTALGDAVSAFELMSETGFTLLAKHFPQYRFPLNARAPWYVLLNVDGSGALEEQLEAALAESFESGLLLDGTIATSEAQRHALWQLRESTPEANKLSGAICNSDTAVPISQIPAFIDETLAAIAKVNSGLTVNAYGHVGDGNIHFNVFPPPGRSKREIVENDPGLIEAIRHAINETTLAHGGSISAEHGIGRLKRDDLARYGDPVKWAVLKKVKQAIDPKGIMNPGALV
ncbi:MAG: FAD-binding oxidoreductase [Pseudomonadota bacterium]